jgi:hypothetical protein
MSFYRAKPHPEAPRLDPDMHGLIWMPEGGFAHEVAHKASPDQPTILEAVQLVSANGRGSHELLA